MIEIKPQRVEGWSAERPWLHAARGICDLCGSTAEKGGDLCAECEDVVLEWQELISDAPEDGDERSPGEAAP